MYELVPLANETNQIVGLGTNKFESSRFEFGHNVTRYSYIASAFSDENIDKIATIGSKKIQEFAETKVKKHQREKLNFLEKHIYLDSKKENKLTEERYMAVETIGSIVECGIKVLGRGGKALLRNKENIEISKAIYELMLFCSVDSSGSIPFYIQSDICRVVHLFPITGEAKKSLSNLELPKYLMNIRQLNLNQQGKEILGQIIYNIYRKKGLDSSSILADVYPIFDWIGFCGDEFKLFIKYAEHNYNKDRYAFSVHNHITKTLFNEISINIADIISSKSDEYAQILTGYDPYENRRTLFKRLGIFGFRINQKSIEKNPSLMMSISEAIALAKKTYAKSYIEEEIINDITISTLKKRGINSNDIETRSITESKNILDDIITI